MPDRDQLQNRRRFLAFIAGSPLLLAQQSPDVIADPKQALNVVDFEPAARKILPPAHFGYLATGVDDDATLRANREGYSRIYLRPRRLVDISKADLRTTLFGTSWDMPIGLAPIGNQKAFHPEGEAPVARAAKAKRTLQILSTATNTSVEDIAAALGRPPWYQLYPTSRWEVTEKLVRRAEAAGCPVLALTVDTQAGRHTETAERYKLLDKRPCVILPRYDTGRFLPPQADVHRNRREGTPYGQHRAELAACAQPQEVDLNEAAHQRHRDTRGCETVRGKWSGWDHRFQPRRTG